jgi:hypothetical protein
MLRTPETPKRRSRFGLNRLLPIVALMPVICAPIAFAQDCPVLNQYETDPSVPMTYPRASDRYAVQYRLGSGSWTDAPVYISCYGGTNASPFLSYAGYTLETSMSFVSVPAGTNSTVQLRVRKLFGPGFSESDHVSVRPSVKKIQVDTGNDGAVQISTATGQGFAGEQFILWWGDSRQGGSIEGLAFFLDPLYEPPKGSKVKTVAAPADLSGDLSSFDTLAFQGMVPIGGTGEQAFIVPANIRTIFLAPGSWVQGKLRFMQTGTGSLRRVYGPGVLDVSRFHYAYRVCNSTSGHADEGYQALSWIPVPATSAPDRFALDGIIITDTNRYATDLLVNSTVNNVKTISWNGNNDGLEFGQNTRASNVFVRSGDDSLKMWASSITVTNATVWQNWNGGVVNLGWFNRTGGDDCLIDGLYVVKTDWHTPTAPSWTADLLNGQLNHQNNAVVASMMVPGTQFGSMHPSVYRNIYVEDPPQVLLSLKILPPDCGLVGLAKCPMVDLTLPSVLNLSIENVFTPASIVENSIGFQTVPTTGYTLTGSMNIGLTNLLVTLPDGTVTPLTSANAATAGKIVTNGENINIVYGVNNQ